jgi:methylated-DNA-[protein]-cysteine S-methyltransferase
METCYIKTLLGTAKIVGDENGISEISADDAENVSNEISTILQE